MINPNKIKKTRKHVVINETLFAEELKKTQIVVELRNFRPSTTASYIKSLSEFLQWLFDTKQLRIADASEDDLRDFLFYLKKERNPVLSPSTINIYNASIRKYFRYVLKKMLDRDSLPYMETDHPLPVVPGKKEVKKLIFSTQDLRLRLAFSLAYGCALRIGETVSLKCSDISLSRMKLTVRAQNSKSRYAGEVDLPENIVSLLKQYIYQLYRNAKPDDWLFPGREPGSHLTDEALRNAFKGRLNDLGWHDIGYTFHSFFRHAHGLHYYQGGADLFQVKERLRHRSINSTLIYVRLDGVHRRRSDGGNPFDEL